MRRTKAEAEETRQNIILAAERVFYEKGVANSSLEDVAAVAGVTRGAIYWHFASKTDLFLAVYQHVPLPQRDMLEFESVATGENALVELEKAACDWLELLSVDEQRQRMLTILLRTNYSEEFQNVLRAQLELDDFHTVHLVKAFEQARLQGRLSEGWTPESATSAVRWLIKGMCTEWLLFGKRFDLARDGADSMRRLFRSIVKS
ncbi:TetR family transcriptional regulator [Rhizobiaceae bacterium n13]|uniref:TetR family transcriptional regulator n=1 Tax=Ferirhizobium litorale TaxID=2927786 RepID=A0AAE3QCU6_9HYPH|nr:TetR family transcriptional regulator [Fererhizobium litorale]MDI7862166.1 TetR family transcriptional regulator [Fererhizobium litorale]MDI7922561.1 TetR family transcriptional regulator [Fererhizobium litorale]